MNTRRLLFPVLCLTFVFVACGKNEKAETPVSANAGQVVTTVVQTSTVTSSNSNTNTNTNTDGLQQFCQYYGGQMNANLCVLSQSRAYQNTFSWGDFNSGFQVFPGQRVTVRTSGNPNILVGGNRYGSGSITFRSNHRGQLTLQAFSSTYSVQQIRIETCYNSPTANGNVDCL